MNTESPYSNNDKDEAINFLYTPLPVTLHTPFETSVNPSGWKVAGRWLGKRKSYTAQVVAQRAKSKKDLAYLITGDENDFGLLGGQETAKRGERISVVPLLTKIEDALRNSTKDLCKKLNTNFPETEAEVMQAISVSVGSKSESADINRYFDSSPYGFRDCNTAAILIFAKAVIDVMSSEIFDKLGYSATDVPIDQIQAKRASEMLVGDWGYFANFDDYNDKMKSLGINYPPYQGENVIKRGEDTYYGLPGEQDKTEREWLEVLRKQYNEPRDKIEGKQRTDTPPGFDGYIKFLDVATIATAAFRYRSRAKRKR
jgi:Protein-glutamine gamma-glutamyltransferase